MATGGLGPCPSVFAQARALRLMVPETQWLAVFGDTSRQDTNMMQFLPDVGDGENLSFLFNASAKDSCDVRMRSVA